jgi:uncharacterized membrane protein YoaK (UPF0700 family)
MGNGIGEVLTFGVGVAISPAGIIAVHNDAVMAVLFLVFGVALIAKGPLTR